ncbi:MAG: PP0621 family protein [Burkholderiales bacterium]
MKFLILLVAVFVVVWLWRGSRKTHNSPVQKPASDSAHDMVRCPVCDLHLPKSDAISGKQSLYCSEAHRQAIEGTPGKS